MRSFRLGSTLAAVAISGFATALGMASPASATPATWSYASRLNVTENSVANGDGSYTYTLALANQDAEAIWFTAFYTEAYQAYAMQSSLADWQDNAYTQFAAADEDWTLPGQGDTWMVNFFDTEGPTIGSLLAGQTATVAFTLEAALTSPIRFGYFVAGDYEWNNYTAVGPAPEAVPEPTQLALFGLGLVGLLLWLRRRPLPRGSDEPRIAGVTGARSVAVGAFAAAGPAVTVLATASMALAAGDVAISQVYGGGGNSGATLTHDFIELHNRSANPVDMTGWSVQYASAAGTSWQRTLLSGTLAAGGYYLVQQAQGAGGSQGLPTPDAVGTIAMSATAGKVALSTSSTVLTGACPTGLMDQIGYGTANCFEGSAAAPGLSNSTASLRANAGCIDTDNNGADFASSAPAPRNATSAAFVCAGEIAPQVASMVPAPNAAGISTAANIVITFNEPVNTIGSWFAIQGSVSGAHAALVSGGPTVFTLNPAIDFEPGETVEVTVFAAQVTDVDLIDPPDNLLADFSASFVTAAPVKIATIQGIAHLSPLAGQAVAGVEGLVTAVASNGFYLQDPNPDANPGTSDAIFVFTNSTPTVLIGDAVSVSGMVSEYRPGGASSANLTITELVSPVVQVLSQGHALPAPVILGVGGRIPPTEVIDDDATFSVETSGSFDPSSDGIDFYESFEAMRVQIIDPVVVGPRNNFGEFVVIGDAGNGAALRTARGGIKVRATDFNPERIMIDDALAATPEVNVGDAFAGPVTGVLHYDFGNFKVLPSALPAVIAGQLQAEISPNTCDTMLSVATFNVENLDPNDPQEKFDQLAAVIVNNLRAPLLLALEEVQDNNGPVNDGTVDATQTGARLIAAIQAAGGPLYRYRDIAPQNNQDGGEPGGNIRVAFLYQQARGLNFINRPGGTAVNSVQALKSPTGIRLNYSPGRIDPMNAAFSNSRKPLVGEFSYQGRTFFVIANHFNSKGGDNPLMGRYQPPVRSSEVQRGQQAQVVNNFVQSVLALDPCARIVVLGDFNDFEFSPTLQTLQGSSLTNLMQTLPENDRYSYVFEGNSQSLDHILVSPSLSMSPATWYDVVHVNSEFADQISDHEPQRACFEKGAPNCRVNFP